MAGSTRIPDAPSAAPIARRDAGSDPYAWLEERDAPEVLDYLKAENAYLDSELADQAGLRETLFEEIRGRIRETDLSLPSPWGPWLYYQRTTAGDEYPRHYRCPRPADGSLAVDEGAEQLLLDPNQLADGGFLSSAPSASAPTRACWPTAWTPAATRSTACSSRTSPAARCRPCPSTTATAA
ncbi:hypothetical protein NMC42_25340 [Pseudomonas aeruginosa]